MKTFLHTCSAIFCFGAGVGFERQQPDSVIFMLLLAIVYYVGGRLIPCRK